MSELNLETHAGQRELYGYRTPEHRLIGVINDLVTYAGVSFDEASKRELGEQLINRAQRNDAYLQLDEDARNFYSEIGFALRRYWMKRDEDDTGDTRA